MILLFDINCDFSDFSTTDANLSHISRLQELYDLFDLSQVIKQPTRLNNETSTLVDHIATTYQFSIADSGLSTNTHHIGSVEAIFIILSQ